MKTRFILCLAAALLSLGLTQPARSITLDSVVILQCRVTGFGPSILATGASESRGIRKAGIGKDCADELELYLNDGFTIRSILPGSIGGSTITYTLTVP
ncbi:MAG: hypothetical protein ACHBNF_14090 [Chromatiales bacterium]